MARRRRPPVEGPPPELRVFRRRNEHERLQSPAHEPTQRDDSQARSKCPHDTQVLHRLIESAVPSSGISPVGSSGTVPHFLAANGRNPQYLTQRLSAERRRTCEAGPRGGLQRTRTPMARRQAWGTCGGRHTHRPGSRSGRPPADASDRQPQRSSLHREHDAGYRRRRQQGGTNGCQRCGRRRGRTVHHRHVIMNWATRDDP
jgi:hypothetical protein